MRKDLWEKVWHQESFDKLWDHPIEYHNNALFHKTEKNFTVDVAKKNLKDFVDVFNKHKVTYWLGYGTLLGFIRENGFIEHDRDIDICCFSHESRRILPALKDLERIGFKLIRAWKRWTVLSIIRSGVFIDIILFNRISENMYKNSSWILYPEDIVIIKKDFLGIKVNIPKNYSVLLRRWYGENWKVPVKGIGAKVEHRERKKK